jgi:hypothetical protein
MVRYAGDAGVRHRAAAFDTGGTRPTHGDWTRVGLPSRASATPEAVSRALLNRIDPGQWPLTPAAQHWVGIPLTGIIRDLCTAGGVDVVGLGGLELAAIGFGLCTSSEFSGPLGLVSKSHSRRVAVLTLRSDCLASAAPMSRV